MLRTVWHQDNGSITSLQPSRTDKPNPESSKHTATMFLKPATVAAFTLASSTFASLTTAADIDQLTKRSNCTCRIIKDSLWHYIVTIPSNGHRGCGSALLDDIRSTGHQPQD